MQSIKLRKATRVSITFGIDLERGDEFLNLRTVKLTEPRVVERDQILAPIAQQPQARINVLPLQVALIDTLEQLVGFTESLLTSSTTRLRG